jgi:glutathione S-transferase
MEPRYLLVGSTMSPYSLKVRAYMDYKSIPFTWEERTLANGARFKQAGVRPLVPLLLRPDGSVKQDSTLIIEDELEPLYPSPEVLPEQPAARFICALLEEFADEWVNKLMFFQRWNTPRDQRSAATRLAGLLFTGTWWAAMARPVGRSVITRRMVPRLAYVGANDSNKALLQKSWEMLVEDLENHLSSRLYLFGGRPSLADFSMYGQLATAFSDPTAGDYIRAHAHELQGWIERMVKPQVSGAFEPLDALFPSLAPLLENTVARHFLPWSLANARALKAGEKQVTLELDGSVYSQQCFKYHALSLAALEEKFAAVESDDQTLAALRKADCLQFFKPGAAGL